MTHLSQATCARIAELGIDFDSDDYWTYEEELLCPGKCDGTYTREEEHYCPICGQKKIMVRTRDWDTMKQDCCHSWNGKGYKIPSMETLLSRDFLIAAFGEGKMVCSCGDGFEADDLNWEPCINCHKMYLWERHGHKLLEAYWTSGVEGCEALLLELLTDSSPKEQAPK